MTKALIFDSGPVINFALNNILWLFSKLKKRYNGNFYVTRKVHEELIENPLKSQRFKFEALQILRYFNKKIFQVFPKKSFETQQKLFDLFNSIYKIKGNYLQVVHSAEVEAIAAALEINADAIVIDERTTRLILENPKLMAKIFSKRLHSKITINFDNLKTLQSMTKGIKMIRSIELAVYAYEQGLLDQYLTTSIKRPNRTLLDAVIWGLKLHGCSITMKEIKEIKEIESKRGSRKY